MVELEFSTADMQRLQVMASAFSNKPKESSNLVCGDTDYRCQFRGLMVEAALSRYFHVPFRKKVLRRGDKHAPDIWIFGRPCEVKSVRFLPAIAKLNSADELPETSEFLIVGYVNVPKRLVKLGWFVTREEFFTGHHMQNFGNRPQRLCMDQQRMRPIEQFEAYCKAFPAKVLV